MRRAGVSQLENHLAEHLRRAEAGEVIEVMHRARPIAKVGPPEGQGTALEIIAAETSFASVRSVRLPPLTTLRRRAASPPVVPCRLEMTTMMQDAAADVDRLTDLALALPPAARGLVAYRIWESLHPGETWPLTSEQTEEIERRVVRGDETQGVDGGEVFRTARARIAARRR